MARDHPKDDQFEQWNITRFFDIFSWRFHIMDYDNLFKEGYMVQT